MTGSNENTPRTGQPSILTNCDKTHLATIIKRNHFIPLCEVTNQLPTKVSRWTVNEALKEHGMGLHIAAKKPNVTLGNINEHCNWCKDVSKWSEEEWGKVIWSDKSSVELGFTSRKSGGQQVNDIIQNAWHQTIEVGGSQ